MPTSRETREENNNLPCQKITQVHKLAVVRVFHIDNTPAVLASTDWPTINDDVVLRTHNSEGDDLLPNQSS